MTKSETAILFDPELPEDRRKEFLTKLEGVITSFGGETLKQDDWGIRKLAYLIRKKHNAYYTFLVYFGKRGVGEGEERRKPPRARRTAGIPPMPPGPPTGRPPPEGKEDRWSPLTV